MKLLHRISAALAAFALGLGLAVVPTSGAQAGTSFGDILDLYNYKLLKTGTELQAAMGPTAAAAWGAETARVATRSASAYNIAAATSGIAEVVPDAVYLRPQDLPTIKPSGGFKNYVTKFSGIGFNKPIGGGVLTVAMIAFEFREDFANGISSLLGIDGTAAVCGDPTASGGFVNFITGQDCEAWAMSEEYRAQANGDVGAGLVGERVCNPAAPDHCITVEGFSSPIPLSGDRVGIVACLLEEVGTDNLRYTVNKWSGTTSVFTASPGGTTTVGGAGSAACSGFPGTRSWMFLVTSGGSGTMDKELVKYGYPSGASDYASSGVISEVDPDPQRWYRCDLTGDDSNHYVADSGTWRESTGLTMPLNCPNLPSGVQVTHRKITLMGGPEEYVIDDQDALPDPLGDGSSTNGVTTAYCETHVCVLELMDLRSGKSCFDSGDACDGWLTSPTRDTDFKCYYGGVAQDFRECYVYAQVFNTAKRLAGNPYADPKTGEDVDVKSGLSLDELTMANDPKPAALGRNCFGGDWGAANPINWVLRPLQCALEWAFVARPEVLTANSQVTQDAWAETAPGQVVTAVAGWGVGLGTTSCAGPHVSIPFFGLNGYPLSACSGTLLASIADPMRMPITVLVLLGGAFAIIRIVSGVIGYRGIGE